MMKNRKTNPNFFPNCFSTSKKSKFANRLKRALPKFRGDRSEVRGVNGRSKFVAASAGRAERKQYAGVSCPSCVELLGSGRPMPLVERSSSERASRIPPRLGFFLLWEAKLVPSWLQDRIFLCSFRKMLQSCVF